MNADNIICPKCNSDNVQTEGVLHLCLDCGYKWEDATQTDLGEMIINQLTPVEEAYLESINSLGKIAKRKGRQHDENH